MTKTRLRLFLDLLLFVLILLIAAPDATGIFLHEWVSLLFIPLIVAHVVLDWEWVVGVTRRLFKPMPGEVRFNYVLNSLLFFFMTTAMFSGIVISREAMPGMGIPVNPQPFWRGLHDFSANFVVLMIGIHLAMHARWIVTSINRYVLGRINRPSKQIAGGHEA